MKYKKYIYDFFISFADEDRKIARSLKDKLSQKGLEIWLDEIEIKPGNNINKKISHGLSLSRGGILIISIPYIKKINSKKKKKWLTKETKVIEHLEIVDGIYIIPIYFDVTKDKAVKDKNLEFLNNTHYISINSKTDLIETAEKINTAYISEKELIEAKRKEDRKNERKKIKKTVGITLACVLVILSLLNILNIIKFSNSQKEKTHQNLTQSYNIIGKITDKNSNPIRDTKVEILESNNYYSYSDSNGTFKLKIMDSLSQCITIKASHEGYEPDESKHEIKYPNGKNEFNIGKISLNKITNSSSVLNGNNNGPDIQINGDVGTVNNKSSNFTINNNLSDSTAQEKKKQN